MKSDGQMDNDPSESNVHRYCINTGDSRQASCLKGPVICYQSSSLGFFIRSRKRPWTTHLNFTTFYSEPQSNSSTMVSRSSILTPMGF